MTLDKTSVQLLNNTETTTEKSLFDCIVYRKYQGLGRQISWYTYHNGNDSSFSQTATRPI